MIPHHVHFSGAVLREGSFAVGAFKFLFMRGSLVGEESLGTKKGRTTINALKLVMKSLRVDFSRAVLSKGSFAIRAMKFLVVSVAHVAFQSVGA